MKPGPGQMSKRCALPHTRVSSSRLRLYLCGSVYGDSTYARVTWLEYMCVCVSPLLIESSQAVQEIDISNGF
jgi:hypothetical protein